MAGRTYGSVAELPLAVESWSTSIVDRETSGDVDRKTTVFTVTGGGHVGRGEDVTYDPALHDALAEQPPGLGLDGELTLGAAAAALEDVDLFPSGAPDREAFRDYRRWAIESALLDLALGQADVDLAAALGREPASVRFLVSTGLGDPPTVDPVTRWLAVDPSLEFKVDVTQPLPADVLAELVETDAVVSIDFKGQYGDVPAADGGGTPSWIGEPDPEPSFYRRILEAFPAAVIEDPAVTDATRPLLEPEADRLAWDAPVHSVAEFESLPLEVGWCNVKPSRFGTLEGLFDFLDVATERDLGLYGGGQYELSVGRGQLHALASLFYPDGPSDIAPRAYNDPAPRAGLSSSPLEVPDRSPGFGW